VAGVAGVTVGADGRPYVADARSALNALRAEDGTVRFRTGLGNHVSAGLAATSDGTIWSGLENGRIIATGPDGIGRGALDTGSRVVAMAATGARIVATTSQGGAWSGRIAAPVRGGSPLLRVAPSPARMSAVPLARIGVGSVRTLRLPPAIGATALVRSPEPGRVTLAVRRRDGVVCTRLGPLVVPKGATRVRLPTAGGRCAGSAGLLAPGRYVVAAALVPAEGRARSLTAPLRVAASGGTGIPDP
jgi:hypothetical protein